MQQLLDIGQWLRGWVLVEDGPDVGDAPLHAVHGIPVWSADSAGFDGIDLVDKTVSLIGQLTDDLVPLSKTLVAVATVREGPGESASTDIAVWTRNAIHADAVAAGFVTLRLGGTARVTVTC